MEFQLNLCKNSNFNFTGINDVSEFFKNSSLYHANHSQLSSKNSVHTVCHGETYRFLNFFFSCVSTKAPPAANMPWGFLFRKNDKVQIKKIDYKVYTKVILNETYSETIGTFNERDVKVLLT